MRSYNDNFFLWYWERAENCRSWLQCHRDEDVQMLKENFQKAKKHDLTCTNIETVCGKDFIQLIINEGTSKLLKLVQELFEESDIK